MMEKSKTKDWWLTTLLADGDYMVASEVASILKVSVNTIRRLVGNEDLKAPSSEYRKGDYLVYLYTPEDVRELAEHFSQRITSRN